VLTVFIEYQNLCKHDGIFSIKFGSKKWNRKVSRYWITYWIICQRC